MPAVITKSLRCADVPNTGMWPLSDCSALHSSAVNIRPSPTRQVVTAELIFTPIRIPVIKLFIQHAQNGYLVTLLSSICSNLCDCACASANHCFRTLSMPRSSLPDGRESMGTDTLCKATASLQESREWPRPVLCFPYIRPFHSSFAHRLIAPAR